MVSKNGEKWGGAEIIHHKIGHEMDVGDGAGRRAVLELHTLSLKVSFLPAKMSSFNNTEVLTTVEDLMNDLVCDLQLGLSPLRPPDIYSVMDDFRPFFYTSMNYCEYKRKR